MHPLDQLTEDEIRVAVDCIRKELPGTLRFNVIALHEPPKEKLVAHLESGGPAPPREAYVLVLKEGRAYRAVVRLPDGEIVSKCTPIPNGLQPLLTPDDCFLAEAIVKEDPTIVQAVRERYGVEDLRLLACDPWSVNIASSDLEALSTWRGKEDEITPRLCQTFLYLRDDADDNHYSHPLDLLPIVDLNLGKVINIFKQDVTPEIPKASVNYHRNKLASNSYLQAAWRSDRLAPLNILQPDGPSFKVTGNHVTWQKWSFHVGFNYREGLVLNDLRFDNRPVLWRASLVEMAVPYGDPRPPFQSKCAFDVGDYGLGYCANSLELGCDCLGHIHYFDATLANSKGDPYVVRKAVCMHEEDAGLLWKHVEYRNGHSEARRARRLVLSFIATVVNYEYLFYWSLHQDGGIELEIKLSGELSTNLLSAGEGPLPSHGTLVAPGVNAQIHQHMFCVRLDMAVDGHKNTITEVDVLPSPAGPGNPFGNAFRATSTVLRREREAQRVASPATARVWRIQNDAVLNPISHKPVAYKLVPFTRGPAHPTLLTSADSAVTKRGFFATKSVLVTAYSDEEKWPAGEFTVQSSGDAPDVLPKWMAKDREIENQDIVVWHAFGVVHLPRPEDFPVMPCEVTGFMLKPDGFFSGNPAIDLPPESNKESKCCA
eukprot:jgi/Mesvir1/6217/Mv00897-RA.1